MLAMLLVTTGVVAAMPVVAGARLLGTRATRAPFDSIGLSGTVRAGEHRAVARVLSRPRERVDVYLSVVCVDPADGTPIRVRRTNAVDRRTPARVIVGVPRFRGASCGTSVTVGRHGRSVPTGYRWRLEVRLGAER